MTKKLLLTLLAQLARYDSAQQVPLAEDMGLNDIGLLVFSNPAGEF